MEARAGEKEYHQQRQKTNELRRKKELQEKLYNKRLLLAQTVDKEEPSRSPYQEVKEVKKEEHSEKKLPNLSQHYRRYFKKSKKKCWICKSSSHFKNKCPHIKCFYCHKYGHIKSNCWHRKMDLLLHTMEKEQLKKNNKKQRRNMRNKYQKEQSEIYKFRLKDSEFKEIKGNHILFYKHEPIGIYTKNNSPPDLNQLQQKNINWKKVDILLAKPVQINNLTLMEDFVNWCACGKAQIDLTKKDFISHIYKEHHGKVPSKSRINTPVWIGPIVFDSDIIEDLFCRSTEDLA